MGIHPIRIDARYARLPTGLRFVRNGGSGSNSPVPLLANGGRFSFESGNAWPLDEFGSQRLGAHMALGVGGPRESEAPGIYASVRLLMATALDVACDLTKMPHKQPEGRNS
jgi:hypothetical protein